MDLENRRPEGRKPSALGRPARLAGGEKPESGLGDGAGPAGGAGRTGAVAAERAAGSASRLARRKGCFR